MHSSDEEVSRLIVTKPSLHSPILSNMAIKILVSVILVAALLINACVADCPDEESFVETAKACHSNDAGSECAKRRRNGCSTPIRESFSQLFGPACDQHYVCYATPGQSKKDCDDSLKNGMPGIQR
ncbi:hypothetical protein BC938DRAFT_470750 [Jimgerdemannia flammicorona]|uniref:Uncharacterized protein n=1 Tax=Jimgerdemannia flammicorona TaxID=994334 RepID=A0A433Q9J6_9FUNG|nr:hypothetical protein BC938DRAFT_470750 [Jimgerdemannia flammicorona]